MADPAGRARAVEVGYFMFDCNDEDLVATFWERLLDLSGRTRRGSYVFARNDAGLGFGFQRVEARKTGKNRTHLDLRAHNVDATRRRVHELGGSEPDGYSDGGFLVMADPEGNKFCILPADGAGLDDEGRAHYRHRAEELPTTLRPPVPPLEGTDGHEVVP